ncbi:hypothetical protein LTR04_002608 [Oleoguttula sp. CCFEE 6159]|nr:hypothetical protein LTR04_002608 [Oleoguttula sp. CCFEE 6159]
MALDNSLLGLLSSLTSSLDSAVSSLPDESAIAPPADGITLLDGKNEIFLSYLQHLAFLIYHKLQNVSKIYAGSASTADASGTADRDLDDKMARKLVELRVYLEKGVRPLEGRLKYQVDKVLRAAEDATRSAAQKPSAPATSRARPPTSGGSEGDSEDDGSGADLDQPAPPAAEIDELSYRPNPSSFTRAAPASNRRTVDASHSDGIYRPPRITPTSLPTTTTASREERASRRPAKSATLDEYVATELSTAPVAEPSIGSTILSGGRRTKSARERAADAEKQTYEESNFVRLPKESKKDRAKKGLAGRQGYGGEEWRGLGAGLDRIERLTQKKGGAGSALDRSRKRVVEDGPRGSGGQMGEGFEKRRKLQSRTRRR